MLRRAALAALVLAACTRGDEPPPMYPAEGDGARLLGNVELMRPITVPDNFVLRPDEAGAAGLDPSRGLVYVGSREGTLLAIDAVRGDVRWERDLGGPVSSMPVLSADESGETLWVGTDNGELFAFDPETVTERWRYATDGRIRNRAVVSEGVVYIVNSRDQVFALDARTGKWRWQYEQELQTDFTVHGHAGLTFARSPSTDVEGEDDDRLFACFDNGKVAALDAGSGEALWLASVASPDGGNFVDCDTTPLVDDATSQVYVAGQSTGVYALGRDDGTVKWRFPAQGVGAVIAGPGGVLVAVSSLEGVIALDREGRLLWRTQLDPGSLGEPVAVGDTLVLTHVEFGLVVLDIPTGAVLGRIPTGSGMSSTPVYDPHTERVYAITNRGVLVGVKLIDP
jgi:outer membrane protein assembly factor BamB